MSAVIGAIEVPDVNRIQKQHIVQFVMLKILQARLQQYVNCELQDVPAGFRKGRLRSLYVGQEAMVRSRHGAADRFKIGKEVGQGGILSPSYLSHVQSTSCKVPG